jgi:hypothetical protein
MSEKSHPMTEHEAMILLQKHNEWRRGKVGGDHANPGDIGVAIDAVLRAYIIRRLELLCRSSGDIDTGSPLADLILKNHEDKNDMHLVNPDRKWMIEAMEEYAWAKNLLESHNK